MEEFNKAAENLASLNEHQPVALTKDLLTDFFTDVMAREEELAAMRAENKEAFVSFASSYGIDTKPLKEGYKFFKLLNKDGDEAQTLEFMRDKIIDIFLPTN